MKLKSETELLAEEFNITPVQAEKTLALIDEGNTVPFIARYRKDETGGLSDTVLRDLNTRLEYIRKLDKRTDEIAASITEQGKMTPQLEKALQACTTLQDAENLYLPFKRKKHTRAMAAREKGLEPLAQMITGKKKDAEILAAAPSFINPEKKVETAEDALAGARDIAAEELSEDADLRKRLKNMLLKKSQIKTSVTKKFADEKTEFMNYYDAHEAVGKIPDHRILAINRGEKRGVLSVSLSPEEDDALGIIHSAKTRGAGDIYQEAAKDAYKRLIFPALEREIRADLKERAEKSAIRMFGVNLKKLLLQRPFKHMTTMGFDPGFRNGCKIAVLDKYGTYIDSAIVYPTLSKGRRDEAEQKVLEMIDRDKIDLIAIGNGTASRESEQFIAELIGRASRKVQYMIVNEAGASMYSASELGTAEYPDLDVSIRGAISIAGRLQDPLSELIKIEPEHIGVGQYQHDVNQKELTTVLDNAVEDAVGNVGADLNRASAVLLSHVVGITSASAKNIVTYREEHGGFQNKQELMKVKGIGAKAYEQCAGFLRVPEAEDVLDRTGIHPESFGTARGLLKLAGLSNEDLILQKPEASQRLSAVNIMKLADRLGAGKLTVIDILNELKKPGRDPRDSAPKPFLKSDVLSIEDLKPGMELTGTVRNVIDFGAFVDIGVHQDGLVHISQIADHYIKHPSEVLSVGDVVRVKVIETDKERGRIGLSMLL
ncbi:MAG: Tex family protein [Eubacteriaceae bacterium]|jgi:uncharacterized protein